MNALIAAVFPYVSCGPIPGAFLNSGPVIPAVSFFILGFCAVTFLVCFCLSTIF